MEQKLKTFLNINVGKNKSANSSNNLLTDTIFKYRVIDFVMKFYELLSLTKVGFKVYVEKDLARDMFKDSLDFKVKDEFAKWMQGTEKGSEGEKSNLNSLLDVKSKEEKGIQELKPNQSADNSNKESEVREEDKKYVVIKELVATEKVQILPKYLLDSNSNQVDVLLTLKQNEPDQLYGSIKEPLIISFTFNCSIFKAAKFCNFAKESTFLKKKILNSKSSKKEKFRSRKSFKKFTRSLSSDKKPSPFKFQTNIKNYFKQKKFSGTKKKIFIKKLKMKKKDDDPMVVSTPQVLSTFMTPVVHFELPEVNKSSKIMVGAFNYRISTTTYSPRIPSNPSSGLCPLHP